MKKIIPVMAMSVLLCACENPLNTMNEMRDITAEMNEKMDQTNKSMGEMKSGAEHGMSEEKRDQKWDSLIPYMHMGKALTDAKVLMLAFEYQIQTIEASHRGAHLREEYIGDALDEFFRNYGPVYELLEETGRLDSMSPLDLDGDEKALERAFYAAGTTMHFTDPTQKYQVNKLNRAGFPAKVESLYDIFKKALISEANGGHLNENERKVLVGTNRDTAIELLQARMTFLTALAVKLTITQDEMSLKDKLSGLWFKVTGGRGGALKVDSIFNQQNDDTRELALTYLDGAVKAKEVLEQIGVEPELQKEMKSILENLHIETDNNNIGVMGVSTNSTVDQVASDSKRLVELKERLVEQKL